MRGPFLRVFPWYTECIPERNEDGHMLSTFFCRAFQCCFAVGARFLPWRTPEVFSGEGSLLRAADILRENGLRRPFVIASRRQCADEHFRACRKT